MAVYCFVLIVGLIVKSTSSPTSKAETPSYKSAGENAVLNNGQKTVFLAVTEDYFSELSRARVIGDKVGIFQMMSTGKVFPVDPFTRVMVLDTGIMTVKVRILSGAHFGKSGFVDREYVK